MRFSPSTGANHGANLPALTCASTPDSVRTSLRTTPVRTASKVRFWQVHTPLSVRTRLRTASLRTVPKVRFGQVRPLVSVETPLETCCWKLRFSEVQKVRFRCYSRRYSLQQSALSPSTGLSTSPEKCSFAVKQAVKCSPEKCAFVGNQPVNHALVTIQQMPDCVDTGMDTAPIQPAEMSQMP